MIVLTHWGWVMHTCVGKLTNIDSDNGLLPERRQVIMTHYRNQCWNIVNWTLRNKLQWNCNRNSNISIEENAFENNVCEKAAILSQPQCVNPFTLLWWLILIDDIDLSGLTTYIWRPLYVMNGMAGITQNYHTLHMLPTLLLSATNITTNTLGTDFLFDQF